MEHFIKIFENILEKITFDDSPQYLKRHKDKITPKDYAIYGLIRKKMDYKTGEAFIGRGAFAKEYGVTEGDLKGALKRLERTGVIMRGHDISERGDIAGTRIIFTDMIPLEKPACLSDPFNRPQSKEIQWLENSAQPTLLTTNEILRVNKEFLPPRDNNNPGGEIDLSTMNESVDKMGDDGHAKVELSTVGGAGGRAEELLRVREELRIRKARGESTDSMYAGSEEWNASRTISRAESRKEAK